MIIREKNMEDAARIPLKLAAGRERSSEKQRSAGLAWIGRCLSFFLSFFFLSFSLSLFLSFSLSLLSLLFFLFFVFFLFFLFFPSSLGFIQLQPSRRRMSSQHWRSTDVLPSQTPDMEHLSRHIMLLVKAVYLSEEDI